VTGISKSPAIFDVQKLDYINGEYIRALSPEAFCEKALPWIRQTMHREDIPALEVAKLLQPRCVKLSDIPEQIDFIDTLPDYDTELYINKKMKTNEETSKEMLQKILPVLDGIDDFTFDTLHDRLMALVQELGVKNGMVLYPLRVALSGKQFTPGGGVELCALFGKDESIARVKAGIEKLA
jgi:glutamyl-tRNA synthetase